MLQVPPGATLTLRPFAENVAFVPSLSISHGAVLRRIGGGSLRFENLLSSHGKVEVSGGSTVFESKVCGKGSSFFENVLYFKANVRLCVQVVNFGDANLHVLSADVAFNSVLMLDGCISFVGEPTIAVASDIVGACPLIHLPAGTRMTVEPHSKNIIVPGIEIGPGAVMTRSGNLSSTIVVGAVSNYGELSLTAGDALFNSTVSPTA